MLKRKPRALCGGNLGPPLASPNPPFAWSSWAASVRNAALTAASTTVAVSSVAAEARSGAPASNGPPIRSMDRPIRSAESITSSRRSVHAFITARSRRVKLGMPCLSTGG